MQEVCSQIIVHEFDLVAPYPLRARWRKMLDLEERYPEVFWPPLAPGYARWARRFYWGDGGATVKVVVWDVPSDWDVRRCRLETAIGDTDEKEE